MITVIYGAPNAARNHFGVRRPGGALVRFAQALDSTYFDFLFNNAASLAAGPKRRQATALQGDESSLTFRWRLETQNKNTQTIIVVS